MMGIPLKQMSAVFLAFVPSYACGVFCRQEHGFAVKRPRDTYHGVIEHERAFCIGAIVVVDLVAETCRVLHHCKPVGETSWNEELAAVVR